MMVVKQLKWYSYVMAGDCDYNNKKGLAWIFPCGHINDLHLLKEYNCFPHCIEKKK